MMRSAVVVAAMACVAGCGMKLSESTVSDRLERVLLLDSYGSGNSGDHAAEALARHRNLPDQAWSPPRRIGDAEKPPPEGKVLVPWTLLHVEISLYPKVSCQGVGPRKEAAAARARPESGPPITASELSRLGAVVESHRIWMLAGVASGREPFGFGPEWLGNYLREAGAGGAVYFPPYQDCAVMAESMPERLPRSVFIGRDELIISARTPFTARVLEACPANVGVREEVIRSRHIPFKRLGFAPDIGFTDQRTRTTARIVGRCARGEARFELGPITGDSTAQHGDPRATLAATLP